jgi:hypothetical protein
MQAMNAEEAAFQSIRVLVELGGFDRPTGPPPALKLNKDGTMPNPKEAWASYVLHNPPAVDEAELAQNGLEEIEAQERVWRYRRFFSEARMREDVAEMGRHDPRAFGYSQARSALSLHTTSASVAAREQAAAEARLRLPSKQRAWAEETQQWTDYYLALQREMLAQDYSEYVPHYEANFRVL